MLSLLSPAGKRCTGFLFFLCECLVILVPHEGSVAKPRKQEAASTLLLTRKGYFVELGTMEALLSRLGALGIFQRDLRVAHEIAEAVCLSHPAPASRPQLKSGPQFVTWPQH